MAKLRLFFAERVEFYLREVRGQAYDVAKAVMVSGQDDLRDLVARAEAVSAVRNGENAATFLAVAAAFKRMRNILEQAAERLEACKPGIRTTPWRAPYFASAMVFIFCRPAVK